MKRYALLLSLLLALPAAAAPACSAVVAQLARGLSQQLDQAELVTVLRSLNASGRLPERFLTKAQARQLGWRPGRSLWEVPALQGRAIGGDRFGNRERRLPQGSWQEADLGYKGGKRGAQRLVYGQSGRYVSVDHYQTFHEVAPCQ